MANQAVKGILVDSTGAPLVDAEVTVFDQDVWPFRDKLGTTRSNLSGFFIVAYSPSAYGPRETLPDIVIEVKVEGELVYATQEVDNVRQTELDLGIIAVTGINFKITGAVVDTAGNRLVGVMVVARDIDSIGSDLLGSVLTDAAGEFVMQYPPSQYREIGDAAPDIVITVLDATGTVELARTAEFSNVTGSVLVVTLVVPQQLSGGWAVTLGEPNPPQMTSGNSIEFLVDNQLTFARMIAAIDNASASVSLMELSYDPMLISTFSGGDIPDDQTAPLRTLAQALLAADSRGVAVRILVSTFLTENPISRSFSNLRDFFAQSPPNNVRLRGINLNQAVHAKALFVDEENPANANAIILGSPLEQGYWDTRLHLQDDLRRGAGAVGIERPIHDVSLGLKGPAISDAANLFQQLWNYLSDTDFHGADKITPPVVTPSPAGNQALQITRSIPRSRVSPAGEAGVFESYIRAMSKATDFLYIENQYLSSRVFIDTLLRVLRSRPSMQVILLINEHPDIPTYRAWQNQRLQMLGAPNAQIGVFSLWSTMESAGRIAVRNYYVHSKVAIVDDVWATVGTANLDGISMQASKELEGAGAAIAGAAAFLGAPIFGGLMPPGLLTAAFASFLGGGLSGSRRNVEMNVSIFDGINQQPHTGNVKTLRETLWQEHLGSVPTSRPNGGWLGHWNSVAQRNIALLNGLLGSPTMQGRILPYSPARTAREQLVSMGVNVSALTVRNH